MRQNLTDAELMTQYIAGDYGAFDIIYKRYRKRLYSYLCKRLPNKSQANDVFQNVFIKFHKCRARYDCKYPLLSWLYTISRCELLDFIKKQDSLLRTDATVAEIHPTMSIDSCYDINLDSERKLSISERKVIKLRYLSDLTFKQIAERLHLSPVAARKINSRGLLKLRLKYTGRHNA